MANPLLSGAILAAAASVFAIFGRQFRAYGAGQPTYISVLEGRWGLGAVVMVVIAAGCSGLITVVNDGSATMFWTSFAAFAVFGAAVYLWIFLKGRH